VCDSGAGAHAGARARPRLTAGASAGAGVGDALEADAPEAACCRARPTPAPAELGADFPGLFAQNLGFAAESFGGAVPGARLRSLTLAPAYPRLCNYCPFGA